MFIIVIIIAVALVFCFKRIKNKNLGKSHICGENDRRCDFKIFFHITL